jgi:hypothetical protein
MKEYTLKQWLSIVNQGVGIQMKKKAKADLIASLEKADEIRRKK